MDQYFCFCKFSKYVKLLKSTKNIFQLDRVESFCYIRNLNLQIR
jgi:hypothetical protein